MENYTKRPKMHHKEGKSNVPTDKNMITRHFVTKTKSFSGFISIPISQYDKQKSLLITSLYLLKKLHLGRIHK